jgi:hypothetical protein
MTRAPRNRRRIAVLAVLASLIGLIVWTVYQLRPYASHPAADTSWSTGGRKVYTSVTLTDAQGQPVPGVQISLLTDHRAYEGMTNASGWCEFPYTGGEMMALELNGVRVVSRASTGPLGELFGPNSGWGLKVHVIIKDPAALGIRQPDAT